MSKDNPSIHLGGTYSDLAGRCFRKLRGNGMGCDQIDKIKEKLKKVDTDEEICDILEQYINIEGKP